MAALPWRWTVNRRRGEAPDRGAVAPRWATDPERRALLAATVVAVALTHPVLKRLGPWGFAAARLRTAQAVTEPTVPDPTVLEATA